MLPLWRGSAPVFSSENRVGTVFLTAMAPWRPEDHTRLFNFLNWYVHMYDGNRQQESENSRDYTLCLLASFIFLKISQVTGDR